MSRKSRTRHKTGRKKSSPLRFLQGLFLETLGVATLVALYLTTSDVLTNPVHLSDSQPRNGIALAGSRELQASPNAGYWAFSDVSVSMFQGK